MPSSERHETLVERIRTALAGRAGLSEQRKMGGTTFLIEGKVCLRAHGEELMVRCRPESTDELLGRAGVRRFEMKGKPDMKGWLLVDGSGFATEADFAFWIGTGLEACAGASKTPGRRG